MSTEELGKKLSIVRDILQSQYGGIVLAVGGLWMLGRLSPTEFDQALRFLGYINNEIGLALIVFFILVFINATFFKPYLEKEKTYVATIKSFEGTLGGEMTKMVEQLALLIAKLERHDTEADRINKIVEIKIIPAVDKLISYYERDA